MRPVSTYPKSIQAILTPALGIGVIVFFYFLYPYHLHYHEQFQLFRFARDYWWEKAVYPGGVSDYIGRFLTQFWVYTWMGACLMALLLVALQRMVAAVTGCLHRNVALYPLSFLPSLACLVLFCDENYMPAAVIQLLLALAAVCLYRQISVVRWRLMVACLLIPLVYWMAGGCVWVFASMVWLTEVFYFRQLSRGQWIGLVGSMLGAGIGVWLLAGALLQYPFPQLWTGRGADRFLLKKDWAGLLPLTCAWWLVPLVGLIPQYIPARWMERRAALWMGGLAMLLAGCTLWGVSRTADWEKEELMGYDYHVYMQQWDEVIRMADSQTPRSSLAAAYLNLALAKTGRLGDDLFRYSPDGTEDLFPASGHDFTSPLPLAEIYYYLGMSLAAGQMAFEAMEGIPDYEKSARGMKRLATVNLINGKYEIARKYLLLLQQALYYRQWATDVLACLYDEDRINQHVEWGSLRAVRYQRDFLFTKEQMEIMLALLYKTNANNRMAYEYLLAYALLENNLEHFYSHYLFGGEGVKYDHIPHTYQEALLYIWSLEHKIDDEKPWPIAPELIAQIKAYAALFNASDEAEAQLKKDFGRTYWYYLHFKNNKK